MNVAKAKKEDKNTDIHYLIGGVFSIAVVCAVILLLSAHIYLIIINETTIEAGSYGRNNPFRFKTWKMNFQHIMGQKILTWFLPIRTNKKLDGINYSENYKLLNTQRGSL